MTTAFRARLGVAALAGAAAVLAGCSDSGDGSGKNPFAIGDPTSSVVATTESAPTSAEVTVSETPATTTETSQAPVEVVPAPAGWESMTCGDFSGLGTPEQVAVLRAYNPSLPVDLAETSAGLLSTGCRSFPTLPIMDALTGNLPD